MEDDRLNSHTPDMAADIVVADLPDHIMTLVDSCREFYSDAEKQKAEDVFTIHQATLSTISSRIDWIDEEITCLRAHRKNLLSKRDPVSRNVSILKSMRSPIRRVPRDVLCEIFLCCLPKTSTSAQVNRLNAAEAPLLLCRVCSKWRRTALCFPFLWKALALRVSYDSDDSQRLPTITVHHSVSTILDKWFARAGSCPLSLRLDLQVYSYSLHEAALTLKFEDVFTRLPNSRIQHLSLTTPYPSDTYFLSKISQEFTKLESIFLQADSGMDPVPAPARLFQSAPRLCSAELHNFMEIDICPKSWIPWSQLTHLRVEGKLGVKMWLGLICNSTNLQRGVFSIDNDDRLNNPTFPTPDDDVVLPHLVDLTVQITEKGKKPDFGHLVFPAIRRLQLLFEGFMSGGSIHLWDGHFPAMGTSPYSSLVVVGAIDITQPQLQFLLESWSSITELHLSVGTNYTGFFEALTSSSDTQQLLPNLDALHCDIRECEDADAILQSLVFFVQSRWQDPLNLPSTRTTAQLRRLTLKFNDDRYKEDFMNQAKRILAPFVDQNLEFVLNTWNVRYSLDFQEMMRFEPDLRYT